jgi:hypothetical protein
LQTGRDLIGFWRLSYLISFNIPLPIFLNHPDPNADNPKNSSAPFGADPAESAN